MTQTVHPWSNDGIRSASPVHQHCHDHDGAIAAPDRHVAGRLAWTGMQSSCRSDDSASVSSRWPDSSALLFPHLGARPAWRSMGQGADARPRFT